DSPAAHYNLGTALSAAGRTADGVAQYREALRLSPGYAVVHNNLGRALLKTGKVDEAMSQFREAARLDPKLAEAYYNIATVARARGSVAEAIQGFRRALRLQPDWIQALGSLAWILATSPDATLRDGDEATRLAQRAVLLTDGLDPEMLDILAASQAAD